MKVFGLDYGEKRIGVAVADTLSPVAIPMMTIGNNRNALRDLVRLVAEEQVERLVVGLPKVMAGREAVMAKQARAFGEELQRNTGLPTIFIDERLTSRTAQRQGAPDVDAAAAASILQSWLDRQSRKP